ncbi:MAG: ankyrin repeat domain-containing protein [Gammaproteobacteria bacterium]|jgi:hypothetical protein
MNSRPGLFVFTTILSVCLLLLHGCATTAKNPHESVAFQSAQGDVTFPPRETAVATQENPESLTKGNYVEVGRLAVRYTIKACSGVSSGRDCEDITHKDDSASRLLSEAASKGGDVVRFGVRDKKETISGTRNGRCLEKHTYKMLESVPTYLKSNCKYDNGIAVPGSCIKKKIGEHREWVTHTSCDKWEQIPYTDTVSVSTGVVWRHDPAFVQDAARQAVLVHGTRKQVAKLFRDPSSVNKPLLNNKLPVIVAIENGNVEAVKALQEKGADFDAAFCTQARDFIAGDRGWNTLERLHAIGIRLGKQGQGCAVPLAKDAQATRKLLKYGVSANASNAMGVSMLTRIANNKDAVRCAEILLRNGADINLRNKFGETALFTVATSENDRLVKFFLAHGANRAIQNSAGVTALDLAKIYLLWMKANPKKVNAASISSQEKIVGILSDKPQ